MLSYLRDVQKSSPQKVEECSIFRIGIELKQYSSRIMTHRVNIIYVNLQSIYGHLYTFGYLGNDRSGFEAIPRGLSRLNLVLYWIYTQNALASSILTSVGLFRARRWP